MDRYKTIHENAVMINPAIKEKSDNYKLYSTVEGSISNLDRYDFNEFWSEVVKDENGKYVLFSDVLKTVSILFSAKKK